MAAAANHSPRNSGSGDSSAALNSPRSKRGAAARAAASSPWIQIVRGAESESIVSSSTPPAPVPAAPSSPSASAAAAAAVAVALASSSLSSPDDSAAEAQPEGSDNAAKKPAWNRPSNGVVEVGTVMGAVSWPALSESTRASPKSSSSDSVRAHSDGSVLISQGTGIASSSQKQVITNNTNATLTPASVTTTRQKSMKRGGGILSGSVTANGGFPQPPPLPPLGLVVEMPSNNAGKPSSAVVESSPRDHTHKESGQRGGSGSQSHGGNDHPPHQRNSFKRGNAGPHPRGGDGSYHHNYGGRRDQDRGSHDWRNFNGRDGHMQSQRFVRGFMRPPPRSSTPPFIPPPQVPVRAFGNPMVYPEVAPPVIYVPAPPPPIVAPVPHHPFFYSVMDPQLQARIVTQIEYYFSNENLIKDVYLRQNMDEHGWVSIDLIAGFKKVMDMTDNVQLILDAVCASDVVEVQDDKVRRRNDWRRWIMPRSVQFPAVSSPQSVGRSSHDLLATNVQSMSLEDKTNKQGQVEAFPRRSLSGDWHGQSQSSSGEGTGQVTVQAGSEYPVSTRSSSK
ncbi:La-related protein 1C [Camellia lanceoleosa]|uniref:La-related protein 1C n=1 Tax=Camellia lanceoleosa TaxID=1840588 RepID=A0ACC0I0F1_9ERIC|nr:La-related protein 1C [Camellia lanceoleosa]